MSIIAFTTDSNCGLSLEDSKKYGIAIIPMPFYINGKDYFENINLSQEEFFRFLDDPATELSTSAPSPGDTLECWSNLLKEYDEVVHVPMSMAMSSSYSTSAALAEEFGGRVQVVNNQRISVTQRSSIFDGMRLAEAGYDAKSIKERLEEEGLLSSIYIMVDNLKYLKKGGRVTPAAALIGTVFQIKPVLQIQGDKLDAFAKCRGQKAAKATMLEAIKKDLDVRFAEYTKAGQMEIAYSYSGTDMEPVNAWVEEIKAAFPGYELHGDPLSLNVSCHIGAGALAITCQKVIRP